MRRGKKAQVNKNDETSNAKPLNENSPSQNIKHTIYPKSKRLSSHTRRRITEIKFRYQFHVGINLFGWVYQQCRLLVATRIPNDNNNANVWNKYKSNANITK